MSVVNVCVVKYRSLRQADHSSRGVLTNVGWLNERDFKAPKIRWPCNTKD